MERITDAQGRTIGYIDDSTGSDQERRIMTPDYHTVGYISRRGTFNEHRHRLSISQLPGLLLVR